MKAAGEWDFQPSPPPFDPAAAFAASVPEFDLPMPGAFDPSLSFDAPPDAYFENGPILGDVSELFEEIVTADFPGTGVLTTCGWDGQTLANNVLSVVHAAAAVQLSAAHEDLGYGTTRLTPFRRLDVKLPVLFTQYIESLGEFLGPDDRRWLLTDFPSGVDALARASQQLRDGYSISDVKEKFWLPVRVDDARTSATVAVALSSYFADRGFHIPDNELIREVFSGTIPPAFSSIAQQLPEDERQALRLLFLQYSSDREFIRRFTSSTGYRALGLLGLEWGHPRTKDLSFNFPTVHVVQRILSEWNLVQDTVESGMNVAFRKVTYRLGDPSQACVIRERPGGATLSSYYSLQQENATWRACFGTPMVYCSVPLRMTAVGRFNFRLTMVPLLRSHVGLV